MATMTSLIRADVEGHLSTKEVNSKKIEGSKFSNALVVITGRSQNKEKNGERSHSRSKSRTPKKEVEC